MSKLKLSGKELRAIGYPEGPVISIAINVMEKNFKHHSKEEALAMLERPWTHCRYARSVILNDSRSSSRHEVAGSGVGRSRFEALAIWVVTALAAVQ